MTFLKQYDPRGNFIRKYIPALRNFPKEHIFEPWKANIKQQSKARCIVGVDYPSRVVTEKEILEIFENAKRLLKKNHNVEISLEIQNFKNQSQSPKNPKPKRSEETFTLKPQISKPENKKFRVQAKESTRIGTHVEKGEDSQELVSQDRIIFRRTIEDHRIDSMEPKKDPREQVIALQSLSKEKAESKAPKDMPEHLIEKRVAGKKEQANGNQFEIIHYQQDGKKPQMAWHKIDPKNGRITFIEKCTGLEKQRILGGNKKALQNQMFSFQNNDTKSQIDRVMRLNETLIEIAKSQGKAIGDSAKKGPESISHTKNQSKRTWSKANNSENQLRDWKTNDGRVGLNGAWNERNNENAKINIVSKTLDSKASKSGLAKMNPLEISTVKLRENGKNTVICHVKVERDELDKSVDIDILNEDEHKKIMVISRKSESKQRTKKRRRGRRGEAEKKVSIDGNDYNFKMNFFMKNNKRMDTDKFFKKIMQENEKIMLENKLIHENTLREKNWNQKNVKLGKRTHVEMEANDN